MSPSPLSTGWLSGITCDGADLILADAISSVGSRLAGRVNVVDCMVDRVCTDREIQREGVNIVAE